MNLLRIVMTMALFCAVSLPASAQNLDLFGTNATTTMTNTATGLFSQQTVGTGTVTATFNSAADAAGNLGLVTGGTSATETYNDGTSDVLINNNGGMVTLSNSATNVLNQFTADGGEMTTLLGAGVTLANEQIAVAQQGMSEGDTTATMNMPDLATDVPAATPSASNTVSNLTLANSSVGVGNAINLTMDPLN